MLAAHDFRIVVPSRKRVESCRRVLGLVPDATICVDEAESDDYAEFQSRLVTHPRTENMVELYDWMLRHFQEPALAFVDDDVRACTCLVGPPPAADSRPSSGAADSVAKRLQRGRSRSIDVRIRCVAGPSPLPANGPDRIR